MSRANIQLTPQSSPSPSQAHRDEEHGRSTAAFHALPDNGTAQGVGLGGRGVSSSSSQSFSWLPDSTKINLVTCMYMSVCAILGCLLRIALAQLFGEGCKNPGSVGWLQSGEPLCITDVGRVTREGGVIFADLPANLLGSFIMGMMQTCAVIGLPKNMPIPWIKDSSGFQNWVVLHLAIRTGFCGSLTTFSSWNSEMVILIYGIGNNRGTQVGLALFGYLIGIETALGSFVFGKNVATWIHNYVNPTLAREAEATRAKAERGVHINRNLPDFERRYLSELDMDVECCYHVESVHFLERWRASTQKNRLICSDDLALLTEIESHILVAGMSVTDEAREEAAKLDWDIKALETWACRKVAAKITGGERNLSQIETPCYEQMHIALPIFVVVIGLLVVGIVICNEENAVSITYRTMWYSCLLAPLGALLRWKLSEFNGQLHGPWSWIPIGTLSANLLACIISIAMISTELIHHSNDSEWVRLTLLAIKIGIAGCLSTVSTFISEVSSLMTPPSQHKGYKYILLTLISSCLLGVSVYGWFVYVIGDGGNDKQQY